MRLRSPVRTDPTKTLVALAGLGLLAALVILAVRWTIESGYRTVSIILDGPDWEATAAREGRDPDAILREAKSRGATAVAVYEWTLKRLAEQGRAAYASSEEIQSQARTGAVAPAYARLLASGEFRQRAVYVAAGPETLGWLDAAFRDFLEPSRVRRIAGLLEVRGMRDDVEQIGLGYLPPDLRRIQGLGLVPVLRLRNYAGLTEEGLRRKVARLVRLGGGHTVVFELTEVLGYDRLVKETGTVFKTAGFSYGRIEVFSERRRQRGDLQLAAQMRPRVIRLFSLTPEELQVQQPGEAKDRFVRSARERNIRLLYVRPLTGGAGRSASETNFEFVSAVARDLSRSGLRTGPAEALPAVAVSKPLLLITAAGALAVMLLGLVFFGNAVGAPVPPLVLYTLMVAGLIVTAALLFGGPMVLWRQMLALGTASIAAALAVVIALRRVRSTSSIGGSVWAGAQTLWIASAFSIGGGLLVAALLTSWDFMMASRVFLGVKIAQVIPVVLVAVFVWGTTRAPGTWRETAAALWEWSAQPLRMRYAFVALVVAAAGVVLLARSGNFGLPVLAIEEKIRAITEDVLLVRPRTKEFLIGHPALLLAGAVAAAGWRRWILPLAAIGAVGQAGIINSFSHIHTPLLYTLVRTVNALVLGTLLGVVGTWIVLAAGSAVLRRRRP